MKNFKNLLLVVLFFTTAIVFGQAKLTGIVVDEMGEPLPGANVMEKGTTNGTSTDFDGKFVLKSKSNKGAVIVSFVGYSNKQVAFSSSKVNLGKIQLEASNTLDEIVVTANSIAIDRKTPVAVSTIKASDIALKLGTQEFPEVLKSTPGVYATKAGGGYGDGRINLRGFNSENVAVMINGVPVNDMENGRVFWSNWAGLGDVTSSMQVQRGLGASKVAVPSVGGTINIISKTTDIDEGGNVAFSLGNDGYKKFGFTYSTGLNDKGLAVTVSAAKTDGEGYVDGTPFTGFNYFLNVSKEFNDKHKLSLTAFGSKQRHGQRQNRQLIKTYRDSERGRKYNSDWGYKQGQLTSSEDNFYHKPQISLNHNWTISDKTFISTAAYASFGSGGGGGTGGANKFQFDSKDYRLGPLGTINFDKIVSENIANGINGSESILRASRNDHEWYGVLSTLKTDLSEDLTLLGGVDYRYYRGFHFTEVTDLLGGQYFIDNANVNNPNNKAKVGDKIWYDNEGRVGWLGGFGQLEYAKDALSAFLSFSLSNTSYQRVDYFQYLDTDPLQKSGTYNFLGYGTKGGVNYNIDEKHGVFVNLGYFEKAPYFNTIFPARNNVDVNDKAENQKITSYELGYTLRGEKLSANFNVYRTLWEDRTEVARFQLQDGSLAFANILGVGAVHQGIEFDFKYKATDNLTLIGMASLGDWRWDNNVEDVKIFNESNELIRTVNLFIKDLHVGDAAQTTAALGLNYKLTPETTFTVDYNYFADLYAEFDPSDRGTPSGPEAWKLPAYHLFDTALRHKFELGSFKTTLTARVNNVFDVEYISDANDRGNSTASEALVYYGAGRTFSVGAKINF
ncbi:TonB-dependent outer membrane receptor [Tenacibaculum maritimum]|uniref:TonB-dependent receptor n=1 Tax=Tenacibaculum maritimum TaxID=107401 RepID=UPI0012E4D775|nr:carboxypeptidase-like regulatory domain-containing protein [Tenacibaculum maritimum]CAA0170873.1 TonB-dependent outer membrane receptor [Tenacibaculum maritimum]CAA0172884.1 TonB-dependent outer membrane receptor [Tenacibaculum maritimum]CAA0177411.1 TonB-dependent outer membrane receptor [Tenacibaculum maritimum]